MATTKQVLFQVGNEVYGIDIIYVKAIEKYTNVIPVPNAPGYIEGIINMRGDIIPVFSLRKKFKLPESNSSDEAKLIIAKVHDTLIAFVVDLVKEIVEFQEEQISQPPMIVKDEETSYIGQVANQNGQLIILLELNGVLNQHEKQGIQGVLKQQSE